MKYVMFVIALFAAASAGARNTPAGTDIAVVSRDELAAMQPPADIASMPTTALTSPPPLRVRADLAREAIAVNAAPPVDVVKLKRGLLAMPTATPIYFSVKRTDHAGTACSFSRTKSKFRRLAPLREQPTLIRGSQKPGMRISC